tara:strand:- start:4213 stop:4521 length:309 start_codon:yes stop_codon:yes gene_type:complete
MITRYRGDTQRLKITLSSNNRLIDLSTVSKVEIGIEKPTTILVILCEKDPDNLSGNVYAPFIETDLDTVGTYPFDVQVTWLDSTKTTFLIDKFKILDDINKT